MRHAQLDFMPQLLERVGHPMNRTADRHGITTRDVTRVVVFAMMVFAPGQAIVAQKAERLSNWTSPVFPVAEYVARRRAALAVLGTEDVLLVSSAEGTSSGDTFRQSDDFEYLVGLELVSHAQGSVRA